MSTQFNARRYTRTAYTNLLGTAHGKLCARWADKQNGFANFLEDMGFRPQGTYLRRRDMSQPFGPGNAHWTENSTNERWK